MANVGCGAKCAKLVILVINFIFMLIGLFLLAFGVFLVIDTKFLHTEYFLPLGGSAEQMIVAAAVILVVGVSLLLITVVGFCAAAKQHAGCLTFYSVILIFLLILQIAAVIIAGVFYDKIINGLEHKMLDMLTSDYGKLDKNETTIFIDYLQSELDCCGVTENGPEDWKTSYYHITTLNNVPDSCCTKNGDEIVSRDLCLKRAYDTSAPDRSEYIYTEGCDAKLDRLIKNYVGILIGVVVGVVIIQIAFIIATCLLKSRVSRRYEFV